MNLIEVYIQEVTRRLPEKNREDISLELRSTIEDMLPDDYSENDVKGALEKLGSPVSLASGYLDRPIHLIGPRYFDIYLTLLKMILPIAVIVSLISIIAEYFIGYDGKEAVLNVVLDVFAFGIWRSIEVGIHVFFWLTLVIAIAERTDKGKDQQPLTTSLKKWTPDDLKNIAYIPKKKAVSKFEVFGSLMWTAIWATVYFYADRLVGIYENNGDGLQFVAPTFNHEVLLQYWPIVIIMVGLEIALALYKLVQGQWTKRMAIYNAILQLVATIGFIVIIINPNLLTEDFNVYTAELFNITTQQLNAWIVGGGIFIFILSAAISVYDGFRKASIY
ncbi:hypothetical protein U5N28_15130 [Lysinibacillus telephonicus]|uniref:Uncharacterized protein n=1 Tax=Lysinibacillus telephonicus TaxID=1714840 RepID=A0A3S0JHL0_9BACI|nr:hypothetical protein [Lysinibacillus telephonicus]RTQ88079.1 hypothetical protein EKG35_18135 [Lysinibacillus telephonicus]